LFGKYAYNITLSNSVDLFGLAEGNSNGNTKYCLLANCFDPTQVRNSYVYQLAKALGYDYYPNFKMTDVYDNGVYLGSYMVTQKVEMGSKALVNVSGVSNDGKATETTTTETYKQKQIGYDAGVTEPEGYEEANYLLEFELCERYKDEISWFVSGKGQPIVVSNPESASANEVKFLKDKWDEVETAVYSGKLDSVRDKIDVESFAKTYLIQELTKNLDGGATSYNVIYKGSEGKFYAEPVWDFDWCLGNQTATKDLYSSDSSKADASNQVSTTDGFFAKYKAIYTGTNATVSSGAVRDFQSALCCENSSFWADVQNIWKNEFYDTATTQNTWLNSTYRNQVKASADMNEYRWGFISDIYANRNTNKYWGTANTGSNFTTCYDNLTTWITNRLKWLNKQTNTNYGIPDTYYKVKASAISESGTPTATVSATSLDADSELTSIAKDTMCVFTTSSTDDSVFVGWYDNPSGTGTKLSSNETYKTSITGNTTLYAVYEGADYQAEKFTLYYVPTDENVSAGYTFWFNILTDSDNKTYKTVQFVATDETYSGKTVYKAECDLDDIPAINSIQYQVYSNNDTDVLRTTWISQIIPDSKTLAYTVDNYNGSLLVASEGSTSIKKAGDFEFETDVIETTTQATESSIYSYTAPTVKLSVNKTEADDGEKIQFTVSATGVKVTHDGKTEDYTGPLVYDLYKKVDGGEDIFINSKTTKATEVVSQEYIFLELLSITLRFIHHTIKLSMVQTV
jgi:hypothetical protein